MDTAEILLSHTCKRKHQIFPLISNLYPYIVSHINHTDCTCRIEFPGVCVLALRGADEFRGVGRQARVGVVGVGLGDAGPVLEHGPAPAVALAHVPRAEVVTLQFKVEQIELGTIH